MTEFFEQHVGNYNELFESSSIGRLSLLEIPRNKHMDFFDSNIKLAKEEHDSAEEQHRTVQNFQQSVTKNQSLDMLILEMKQLKEKYNVKNSSDCFNWESRLVQHCEKKDDSPGKEQCEKAVNNGYWEICKYLIDVSQCDKYEYKSSASDFFKSPYFCGATGFFIGLVSIILIYFLPRFLSKKHRKGMTPVPSKSTTPSKTSHSNASPSDGALTEPIVPARAIKTPKTLKTSSQ